MIVGISLRLILWIRFFFSFVSCCWFIVDSGDGSGWMLGVDSLIVLVYNIFLGFFFFDRVILISSCWGI